MPVASVLWKAALCVVFCLVVTAGTLLADPLAAPSSANNSAVVAQPARPSLAVSVTIFVLAILLGVEVIGKVPATLHTPLMSGSNAISGITVVGAVIAAGALGRWGPAVAFFAIVLAMINVVGGFLVTHRMLQMFKRK
ncbi:MAG: NAD(P) transhydrogenase subunit alpha [Pirellulaceae bacterium]